VTAAYRPGDRVNVTRVRPWEGPHGLGVVESVDGTTCRRAFVRVAVEGFTPRVVVEVNALGVAVDRPDIDLELIEAASPAAEEGGPE
jgi:hypothetical protein